MRHVCVNESVHVWHRNVKACVSVGIGQWRGSTSRTRLSVCVWNSPYVTHTTFGFSYCNCRCGAFLFISCFFGIRFNCIANTKMPIPTRRCIFGKVQRNEDNRVERFCWINLDWELFCRLRCGQTTIRWASEYCSRNDSVREGLSIITYHLFMTQAKAQLIIIFLLLIWTRFSNNKLNRTLGQQILSNLCTQTIAWS